MAIDPLEETPVPNATPRRLALNIPLIVLWVASIAVGAIGLWQLRAGNAGQADFYNTGGSDYLTFLDLQTQSTIGGMLLVAGVVGVLVALAVHARNRAAAIVAREAAASVTAVTAVDEFDEFDDVDADAAADAARDEAPRADVPTAVPAAVPAAVVADATPTDDGAAEASAAVTATEAPGPDAETTVIEASNADETEADTEPGASGADRLKH